MVRDMAELEGSLKAVETEMRDISGQSAVKDGRVDPQFLRKKKAVDRRFEVTLKKMTEKRKGLSQFEEKLLEIDEKKEQKEDQLKQLETDLVSLLVQQQKKMLDVLSSIGSGAKA